MKCTHELKNHRPSYLLLLFFLIAAGLCITSCSSGGGSAATGSSPVSQAPAAPDAVSIQLSVRHMVYDPNRQRLYASVWGDDTAHPNTIAIINPSTSSLESTIPVGTNPDQLALSIDARYLYVGTDGDGSVQRIDLNTRTVVLAFQLGTDPIWNIKWLAGSISVLPGRSTSIAVARAMPTVSPPYAGVAVFDDGIQRPSTLDQRSAPVNQIYFSNTGDTIYGATISDTSWRVYRFNVDSTGVGARDSVGPIFQKFSDGMVYHNGRIYTTNGLTLNATSLTLLGKFSSVDTISPPAIDEMTGHAYFISRSNSATITEYDLTNFIQTGTTTIQKVPTTLGFYEITKMGSDGFAFVAAGTLSTQRFVVLTKKSISQTSISEPTLTNLPVNHLLCDPRSQRLYASVPSSAGLKGNSIAVIDSALKRIDKFIPIGSEPNALALASDGSYLYVALDGAGSIARLNLLTQNIEQTFVVGRDPQLGVRMARSMAVMPGSPKTLAVAAKWVQNISPNDAGVILFDDGVVRTNAAFGTDSTVLAFGDSASDLFGYDELVSATLTRFHIDPTGVSQSYSVFGWFTSIANRLQVNGGKLFAGDGSVVDPTQPAKLGVYPIGTNRGFAVDDVTRATYFIADDVVAKNGLSAIYRFDEDKFTYTGRQPLATKSGSGFDLISCGPSCLAYASSPGVTIVAANFIPAVAPTLTDLPLNRMIHDPARNKIYASVPGGVGQIGNSIIAIDPLTQSIEASLYVGSEPDPLAISKDGSSLYVGLDGAVAVAKVDLQAFSMSHTVRLGYDPNNGLLWAWDIAVAPGNSDVIAVSRKDGSVIIQSYGVRLPNAIASPFTRMYSIAFADDAHLYGYDNQTNGFTLYRLAVDSSGVTLQDQLSRMLYGFFGEIRGDSGLIYSTNGQIVDANANTLVGAFTGADKAYGMALDNAAGRAYFVTYDSQAARSNILAFDKNTMQLLGTQQVPVGQPFIFGYTIQSYDLIKHVTGLAYLTASGRIVFTSLPNLRPPVDLGLSHTPANHLIYDSSRQRIYASVPGRDVVHGNTITIINPFTETVDTSIAIGSEPGVLALSSDLSKLYVGLQNAALVKRVNLNTKQVDLQFGLGFDSFLGPKFAQDIAVVPGNADVVALSRMYANLIPPSAGLSIYQTGVELPNNLPAHSGNNSLVFSTSPDSLYGYENEQTSFRFSRMKVDSSGVTLVDATGGLISGIAKIVFNNGLVYSTVGTVVNPLTNTVVKTFSGIGTADAVVADGSLNRVFFLTYTPQTRNVSVVAFDNNTAQQIGSMSITSATARGTDLVRWGPTGLAVSTSNEVVLIPTSILTQ